MFAGWHPLRCIILFSKGFWQNITLWGYPHEKNNRIGHVFKHLKSSCCPLLTLSSGLLSLRRKHMTLTCPASCVRLGWSKKNVWVQFWKRRVYILRNIFVFTACKYFTQKHIDIQYIIHTLGHPCMPLLQTVSSQQSWVLCSASFFQYVTKTRIFPWHNQVLWVV